VNSIPETPYGRLLPHHAALVEQSAISPDVACARGYQSVVVKAELSRLGFGGAQCHVPGLLIPVRGVSGEVVTHQFRPDRPRIVNDKPVKYETPRGSRMAIDVPPTVRPWLGDPTRPLLVTEGIRKADSAATRGLCCVGLLGVWNFRGSNRDGGKVALPDWESIALNGRRVYIVFDSDVMLKPAVHAALVRLKAFLETRGSQVLLIYLPPGDGGIKTGLDDFFSTGATVQDLLALASPTLRPLPAGQADEDTGGYAVEGGCLCRRKHTRDGNITEPLANFAARITEDLALDDGEVTTRAFQIEGSLAGGIPLPSVRVPASRFNAMGWVTEHWGARAVIRAGMSSRDYLREAIQRLSPDVQHRKVFTHTGWREIEGEWAFLTANGAVERDDSGGRPRTRSLPAAVRAGGPRRRDAAESPILECLRPRGHGPAVGGRLSSAPRVVVASRSLDLASRADGHPEIHPRGSRPEPLRRF
jgi:hypothetical protein